MSARPLRSKIKRVAVVVAGVLGAALLSLVLYVEMTWDHVYEVPFPELQVSTDPEVIERGRYLVHGPAHCSNCHVASLEEMTRANHGENIPLHGGVPLVIGPLGTLTPINLTPDPETGIGRYSDQELFRMLRHSIKRDGTASPPLIMPFQHMADDDHVAIVSYLRSMAPVRNETARPEWSFIGRAMLVFSPAFRPKLAPEYPDEAPAMEATVERGEYLARHVANCYVCHTQHDMMTLERTGEEWGGGMEFEPDMPNADPKFWFRSPNLTSHASGVLQNYPTAEAWIARFREGGRIEGSPMHWGPFTRMSDEDLAAIYVYLQAQPPVASEPGPVLFEPE